MIKKNTTVLLVVAGLILLTIIFDARVCPIYNIFHIPCPGCGLTRSVISLFKGHIIESFEYNILGIPIVLSALIYIVLLVAKKLYVIDNFMSKHKVIIIILSVILLVVVEIINYNNPLLYD